MGIKIQQDSISICAMASMIDGPKEDEARLIVLEQKEEHNRRR